MSIEYTENRQDNDWQDAKRRFFDLIVSVDDELEKAEQYGNEGSPEMLSILDDLRGIQGTIEKSAKEAREFIPPKNYEHEREKLARHFLPNIIRTESIRIKDSIDNLGCLNKNCKNKINELKSTVDYYNGLYPDLDLEKYIFDFDTICRNVPRKTNLFSRLFGGID